MNSMLRLDPFDTDPRPIAASIEDLINAVAEHLPQCLVPPEAMESGRGFGAVLPACWDWLMLETSLAPGTSAVDLLTSVTDVGLGRITFQSAMQSLSADGRARLGQALPVLSAWASSTAPMDEVGVLWLEWDAPLISHRDPLVFLSVDPAFWRNDPCCDSPSADVARFFHDDAEAAIAEKIFDTLPQGARSLSVASTLPRNRDAIRVFVTMKPRDVVPWLDRQGWPGDLQRVEHWIRLLYRSYAAAFIQVELVREGNQFALSSHLGLESPQTSPSSAERADRARCLEAFVAAGLADAHKANAVLDWPDAYVGAVGNENRVVCRSHHLKLRMHDGVEMAKVYLGVHTRALPDWVV